jgi:hypothetical protein
MAFLKVDSGIEFKIGMFIDNELNEEEKLTLEQDIALNPDCKNMIDVEQEFRIYLKNHIQRPSIHPQTIQNIKNLFEN